MPSAAQKRCTPARKSAPSRKPKNAAPGPTPALEWVAAAVGLAALFLIVGMVASEAVQPDNSPPEVTVTRLGVSRSASGYLVEVRAANHGGSPAAQVVVEGELVAAGVTERAEATFDFVADHSSREGGLFFTQDPQRGTLTLRAKGYAAP